MHKPLPQLVKPIDCKKFIVTVENEIHYPSEREIFTFAVYGFTDEYFTILHCKTIINNYTGKINSPFREYCRILAQHYNVKVNEF